MVPWNLVSQILFLDSHFSCARTFGLVSFWNHGMHRVVVRLRARLRRTALTLHRLQRVGLPTFHARSIAVRLQDCDRLCGSLSRSVPASFLWFFNLRTPDLTVHGLRQVPCILLSGLSSRANFLREICSGENPDSKVQSVFYQIALVL